MNCLNGQQKLFDCCGYSNIFFPTHFFYFSFTFLEDEEQGLDRIAEGGVGEQRVQWMNHCLHAIHLLAKSPPTSFFPVTSTNVGIRPQIFLTFSFNTFAILLKNFKFAPSASPKLLNFNQDHPSKKVVFLVKSL